MTYLVCGRKTQSMAASRPAAKSGHAGSIRWSGITAGTVRLSIGLEDSADLIEDLDRALKAASRL